MDQGDLQGFKGDNIRLDQHVFILGIFKQCRGKQVRIHARTIHKRNIIIPKNTYFVKPLLSEHVKILFDHVHDDLLGFNLGELKIAVKIPFHQKPFPEKSGQLVEQLIVPDIPYGKPPLVHHPLGYPAQIIQFFVQGGKCSVEIQVMDSIIIRNDFIEFCDKHLDLVDKFQNAFRDDHQPVIFAECRPPDNNITNDPG